MVREELQAYKYALNNDMSTYFRSRQSPIEKDAIGAHIGIERESDKPYGLPLKSMLLF